MALLGGIKTLLHEQGMTIKGVQKMLREQGVRHVAGLGPQPLDPVDADMAMGEEYGHPGAGHARDARHTGGAPSRGSAPRHPGQGLRPARRALPCRRPRLRRNPRCGLAKWPRQPPSQPRPLPRPRRRARGGACRTCRPNLLAPGLLSAILARDPAALSQRSARLAPVVARLATLRDRLRADVMKGSPCRIPPCPRRRLGLEGRPVGL